MTGRRRKWLIAVVVLAFVVALGWALLGRSGKMQLQLVFVGYTNKLEKAPPPSGGSTPVSFHMLEAIVLATNSGTVAIEIYSSIRPPNIVITGTTAQMRDGFAAPRGPVPSQVLKPGETLLI